MTGRYRLASKAAPAKTKRAYHSQRAVQQDAVLGWTGEDLQRAGALPIVNPAEMGKS
jgi:hypothetical protein